MKNFAFATTFMTRFFVMGGGVETPLYHSGMSLHIQAGEAA